MATAAHSFPDPMREDESRQLSVPPHSRDAEQAVLGGLMGFGEAWFEAADVLEAGDFYFPEHRQIYRVMQEQSKTAKPIDVIALIDALTAADKLETIGGVDYLTDLAENNRGTANLRHYAGIVRDRSILRQLISAGNKIVDHCHNTEGAPVEDVLDQAERTIFRIADDRPKDSGPEELKALLEKAVDRIEELAKYGDACTGLPSGFIDLDRMTSGWQKSDLIIVAGRPSMGKTAFAMNAVEHAILHQDQPVLVFSLEMPAQSLVFRMLSSVGHINHTHIRGGKIPGEQRGKLKNTMAKLKGRPLYVDDSSGLTPTDMRARARRLCQQTGGGLGMIVVDYLQLMHLRGKTENRVAEISEISRSMKLMAREFQCPVMALSQLNRSVDQRVDKRPMMSDLRESGAIEQDADLILFLYRAEVYKKEDTPEEEKGVAELIIGKHRNGDTGKVRLSFLNHFTRFENHAAADQGDYFPPGY
ncbi:MAG: replicative DNA helicase [Gammaproteobacteria bacterium]|nr:replicative DNA helicase [Gammaproteobacteria bacterium]MCY4181316.1 replicative DNA helicase [Gammaproteobacteria bacterium]MCY4296973.1 replicative DNA helicase [Gammaproteobacteria bacterium]